MDTSEKLSLEQNSKSGVPSLRIKMKEPSPVPLSHMWRISSSLECRNCLLAMVKVWLVIMETSVFTLKYHVRHGR